MMALNENVTITDIEWMFGQALVYRMFVIAYEVNIFISVIYPG